jgi:hypothetical protein
MSSVDSESISKIEEKITFFTHMFNFDENTKNELTNIMQYTLLAIIPVIGLNKLMKKYIPQADDDKSSLEIVFEVTIQSLLLFFGLFYIHRFVTFFSPYSSKEYPEISIISIVLAILLITLSLQSKLGEKSNILVERLNELWNGETSLKEETKKRVKQPVAQKPAEQAPTPNYHVSQHSPEQDQPRQELPNFNMMYHNTAVPTNEETQLLAANEALGGGSFGSLF